MSATHCTSFDAGGEFFSIFLYLKEDRQYHHSLDRVDEVRLERRKIAVLKTVCMKRLRCYQMI